MANIFTIKVGSPNLLNSPLLEGELGFHLTNNTLYIGSSNGTVPVGGAGTFVPWENTNTDKTLTLGSLNLVTTPLAEESGGTGVTKLSDLTFTKDQITDLDLSNYLTEVNWSEVGFEKEGENWSLDINTLKKNGKDVATEDWVNNKGFLTEVPSIDLTDYYNKGEVDDSFIKKNGDTMKGQLTMEGNILLNSTYNLTITSGDLTLSNGVLKIPDGNKKFQASNAYISGWGDCATFGLTHSNGDRHIDIWRDDDVKIALRYNGNIIYHQSNIIYSSNQPSGINGMIWLKPV